MFKAIKEQHHSEYFGAAQRHHQKPFRVWVMFWPDKNNLFPFDDGCEIKLQDEALNLI